MADLTSLLLAGPLSANELMARLAISQATLSRLINKHPQIVRAGRARATRYALCRPLRGQQKILTWRISPQGQAQMDCILIPVWPQGSCLVLTADRAENFYDGLPWFLNDMRPQGFLGRAWGREHADRLTLTADIRLWTEDDCLLALTEFGVDMPGDRLVGQSAYERWLTHPSATLITDAEKPERYPQRAAQALSGDEPGSSAGGEQPKFLCYAETALGHQHCLVKFSGDKDNAITQRWRDLLRAEQIAQQCLAETGIPAAQGRCIESAHQVFLEIPRFDRQGISGRRGIISLEAVSAEYLGQQSAWPVALQQLFNQQRIDEQTLRQGTMQWAFGRLIANNDMHAGNLSFFTDAPTLHLTPAYDMLPMALAPTSAGHMRDRVELHLDASLPRAVWLPASDRAKQYWHQLSHQADLSADFRRIAVDALQQLAVLDRQIAQMA